MKKLSQINEILTLKPKREDLIAGAKYAAITLPWTFNRMMLNTNSAGQQLRALNIAKGIVAQEVLHRALESLGVSAEVQRKSYRDEDLFDFHVTINGTKTMLDVKTLNYYSNYAQLGRTPLSPELIINNSSYPGPDWRLFFPMLVPHTQIQQEKEAYCFAIASSIDFRRNSHTNRTIYALTAFPYGQPMEFLASKALCASREEVGKGFFIECSYVNDNLLNGKPITLHILGEWDGAAKRVEVHLRRNQTVSDIGPFSCVSSFQITKSDYDRLFGQIEVSVSQNQFTDPIRNTLRRNINQPPQGKLTFTTEDFCNLILPSDYTIYFVGWITKEAFLAECRNYTGWVWPKDSINKYENQPWNQITEADRRTVTRAGFADCIQENPSLLKAGWLKTTGRGGGACCYVYPNIGRNGGVKETNLYVLPQNLNIMESFGR